MDIQNTWTNAQQASPGRGLQPFTPELFPICLQPSHPVPSTHTYTSTCKLMLIACFVSLHLMWICWFSIQVVVCLSFIRTFLQSNHFMLFLLFTYQNVQLIEEMELYDCFAVCNFYVFKILNFFNKYFYIETQWDRFQFSKKYYLSNPIQHFFFLSFYATLSYPSTFRYHLVALFN